MNKKRWLAFGIAGALALVWLLLLLPTTEETEFVEGLLTGNGLQETVIESGDTESKIAQLEIDGSIVADGGTGGLFSPEGYNHTFFMTQLEAIAEDPTVKGIFLEVNSPGGGVYESAEIARELKAIQKERKIPFYVSMKNMAASGGYYVAASADKIYAAEETMTGSIGVIMSGLNMAGLLDKLGMEDATIKSGEMKDVGSTTRPWTEKDRKVMQEMIDGSYDRFVKVVSEGRKMSDKEVRKIADGRIYDGVQAFQNGLVDELGFPKDALASLRSDHKLSHASLVKYEMPTTLFGNAYLDSLLGAKVSKVFTRQQSDTKVLASLFEKFGSTDAPRMMYLYGGE